MAGLVTASRVYPTCGKYLCGSRAGPTSDAIAKLAQLSAALRKSVAGFRLPEAAAASTQRLPAAPDAGASQKVRRIAAGNASG